LTRVTSDLLAMTIRDHFPAPDWVAVPEVQLPDSERRVDLIAVNTKTLEVCIVELKVSRGDWLHEYKNPDKSRDAMNACDRFYLCIGEDIIVKDSELPEDWGLLVARGDSVSRVKPAPILTGHMEESSYLTILGRVLRKFMERQEFFPGIIQWAEGKAERRGYNRGYAAAGRLSRVTSKGKVKHDPGNPHYHVGEDEWPCP